MVATFTLDSCITGYHMYKENPCVGNCEDRNPQDPHAVGLKLRDATVGHVPHTISCIFMLFLRRGGTIIATVIGPRQCSRDLPQGGLELPCRCKFTGERTLAEKTRQLLLNDNDGVSEIEGNYFNLSM